MLTFRGPLPTNDVNSFEQTAANGHAAEGSITNWKIQNKSHLKNFCS